MAKTTQTPGGAGAGAVTRVLQTNMLRDLHVAPKNVRQGEAPDDDLPQLAATILAAGPAGRRKDELADRVAAQAVERRWAPACLSGTAAPEMDGSPPAAAAMDAAETPDESEAGLAA